MRILILTMMALFIVMSSNQMKAQLPKVFNKDGTIWSPPEEEMEKISLELLNEADYIVSVEFTTRDGITFIKDNEVLTSTIYKVVKVYKGDIREGTIEMILHGGRLELEQDGQKYFEEVPATNMLTNHIPSNILLLKKSNLPRQYDRTDNNVQVKIMESKVGEGHISRNDQNGKFYGLGYYANGTTQEKMDELLNKVGIKTTLYEKKNEIRVRNASVVPTISNLSPLVLRAGSVDQLTITGNNFGSQKGKVYFIDAGGTPIMD